MVAKSKQSSIIAEEIRNLGKFLCKSIPTRRNSILFLIRSILKLGSVDLSQIINYLPIKTKNKEKLKNCFV